MFPSIAYQISLFSFCALAANASFDPQPAKNNGIHITTNNGTIIFVTKCECLYDLAIKYIFGDINLYV